MRKIWLTRLIILTLLVVGHFFLPDKKPQFACANSLSCKESLKLRVENGTVGVFAGRTIIAPPIDLVSDRLTRKVLGKTTTTAEKRIEVDLTTQTVKAYEGDKLYFETKTSTGKWGRTPTGEFTIWVKLRATRMSGGEGADFYDLPNVPYVMFFSNDEVAASRGFSLHGAYWHNNFGHPMSHGCVNLRPIDAKVLYDWVNPQDETDTVYANSENPGTKIIITGEAAL